MLTRQQGMKIAEAEAWATYGRKYAGLIMFRRFLAGPLGVLAAATALGTGGYLLVRHLHLPAAHAGLPVIFWVMVVGLLLGTGIAFRPGRLVPAATQVVKIAVFGMLWLGLITYGITVLI